MRRGLVTPVGHGWQSGCAYRSRTSKDTFGAQVTITADPPADGGGDSGGGGVCVCVCVWMSTGHLQCCCLFLLLSCVCVNVCL